MGKRCQVCDGPVVNGRCKYCGMPYRNDLELYHLNEDRSEHYRHASAKVRKAMAESEIPLPDRNKTANKSSKTSTVKKTVPKAKTEKVQTSVKKASAGQNVGTRTYTTNRNPVQKRKEKKKSKKGVREIDIKPYVILLETAQVDGGLQFVLRTAAGGEMNINPHLFVDAFRATVNVPVRIRLIRREALLDKTMQPFCRTDGKNI